MSRTLKYTLLALALLLSSVPSIAQDEAPARTYTVTITNVTRAQIFSPPIAVSHSAYVAVFQPGTPALPELAELAEDGSPAALAALLAGVPTVFDVAVAGGPVMPGESLTLELELKGLYDKVSVLGMLITTNDAFFAVNSVDRPRRRQPGVHYALVYDAGSEENNEDCGINLESS